MRKTQHIIHCWMRTSVVILAAFGFAGTAYPAGYDYFRNIQYPGVRRADVSQDKIAQEGGPNAAGYNKRVVTWWPMKGVDVVDVPKGVELRTWTIRTPQMEPLVEAGVFAKWWPEDLRGKKQFKAYLLGFRGIGTSADIPYWDAGRIRAQGKGICPGVILRLEDGRKRCFSKGSFSDADQKYIVDLYDKEMARVHKALEPATYKIPPDIEARFPQCKLYSPGTFHISSDHFVISAGSEELNDGIPGVWVNKAREKDAEQHHAATLRMFEDYWAYSEYAGHMMPFWEKPVQYKYSVVYGGTLINGIEAIGRGNGGGYGGCSTACWEGLYHEWGHGCSSDPMGLIGGAEARCDSMQTMSDPSLVRKVSFGVDRPYKNFFWGQYPGGFGYTMMGDDPNWGYGAVTSFPSLMSEVENTPIHAIARLGQERGIWDNGIKGVGDLMGEIGARWAEYDYELEGMLRETYPQPNRAYLVAVDRYKGVYRSTRTEAPEPFGVNVIRLVAEPGAKKITVNFQGLYDPDTYGDWRVCIVAVGANGRPRYTPLWNKGEMSADIKEGDRRFWLTVTATPYALANGAVGGILAHIYQGGFTYKYPYEVQLTGCRPANPSAPVGENENMDLIGPSLMSRADADLTNCGLGDWPYPSDSPEYPKMKAALEAAVAKAPVMIQRYMQDGLFTDAPFCPIANRPINRQTALASAAFLGWRAQWLLDNAQGSRHPNGGGWVAKSANVAPTAYVGPDCMVLDGAQVLDNAIIEDYAIVSGPKVLIKDHAKVYGKAVVCGDVTLTDYARVYRSIFNRASKIEFHTSDKNAPFKFQMITGAPVKRDGPEERVEVFKNAGYKLQANYAFDRPETILLEDWYQEHSFGMFGFGAHSADLVFYDGNLYGKPGFVKDGDIRAFTFNGKDQYAEADPAVADLGSITIDMSLKWDGGSDEETLFDFGVSDSNYYKLTISPSGNPGLRLTHNGKSDFTTTGQSVPTSKWVKLRVEIDGRRARLLLNDQTVAYLDTSFRPADAFPAGVEKRNFIAANRHRSGFFKGAIDYMRIYYTVYDDFTKAPEPPMVCSRRIDPDFIDRFDKTFADYDAQEAKCKDDAQNSDIYKYYVDWGKKIDDRIAEMGNSDEVSKLEKQIKDLQAQYDTRRNELGSEWDKKPETIEKRKKWDEIEQQRRTRFDQLRNANTAWAAVQKEEQESGKIRGEIEQAARAKLEAQLKDLNDQQRQRLMTQTCNQDPRYIPAGVSQQKARDKMGQIERGIWADSTLVSLENERQNYDANSGRDAFINRGTIGMPAQIGELQGKVKTLRVDTALASNPDEYQSLVSMSGLKDQLKNGVVDRYKSLNLPVMPEDRMQMHQAAPFQLGKWSTTVDWDGRTTWEKSYAQLSPLMQRYFKRMKPYMYH